MFDGKTESTIDRDPNHRQECETSENICDHDAPHVVVRHYLRRPESKMRKFTGGKSAQRVAYLLLMTSNQTARRVKREYVSIRPPLWRDKSSPTPMVRSHPYNLIKGIASVQSTPNCQQPRLQRYAITKLAGHSAGSCKNRWYYVV